ncbi:MAG: hypothetical protein GWO78_00040 [Dehalococcoidales bacterium]|nr:hypothetical protein [Dehalococcoidales bacterium]
MKLLINITIDKREVPSIISTLNSPNPPSSIDFGSLVPISANKISNVKTIATWEKIRFNFLDLFDRKKHIKIKIPNTDGIKAVGEDTSKNPHNPIRIKEIEFTILALFVFINS